MTGRSRRALELVNALKPLMALDEKDKRIKYLEGRIADILVYLQNPTEYSLLNEDKDGPSVHAIMRRITEIVTVKKQANGEEV